MKEDMLGIVCCPLCKAELNIMVKKAKGKEILEGTLTCTKCHHIYQITKGIPNLLPPG